MTAPKLDLEAARGRLRAYAGRVFAVNLGLAVMLIGMASVVLWLARGDTGALLASAVGRFFLAGGAIALIAAIVSGRAPVRKGFALSLMVGLTGVQSSVAFVFWWVNGLGWTVPLLALCAHCYAAYELVRVARLRTEGEAREAPPGGPEAPPESS